MNSFEAIKAAKTRGSAWATKLWRQLKPVASEKCYIVDDANPTLRDFQTVTFAWPASKVTYGDEVPFWKGVEVHPLWTAQEINQSAPLVALPPLRAGSRKQKKPKKRRRESKTIRQQPKKIKGWANLGPKPKPKAVVVAPLRKIETITKTLDWTDTKQKRALDYWLRFERSVHWDLTNKGKLQGAENIKWTNTDTAVGVYAIKATWSRLLGGRSKVKIEYKTFTLNSQRFIHFGPVVKSTDKGLRTQVSHLVDSTHGPSIVQTGRQRHQLNIDGRIPNSFKCLQDGARGGRYHNQFYRPGIWQERQFFVGETFGCLYRGKRFKSVTLDKLRSNNKCFARSDNERLLQLNSAEPEEESEVVTATAAVANTDTSAAATIVHHGDSQVATFLYEDEEDEEDEDAPT